MRCPYCGFTCETVSTLGKHQNLVRRDARHLNNGEKTLAIPPHYYGCDSCAHHARSKLGLLNHYLRKHRVEVRAEFEIKSRMFD